MPRKKADPNRAVEVERTPSLPPASVEEASPDSLGEGTPPPSSARVSSRAGADKTTPVMRQWDDAKREYPDAVLFFRLGDFYEMFRDDAVLVSRELGLTLTSRNKGAVDEIPMAGVPHHAAHGYIAKLLQAGYKIALCEQMADPSKVKGIVPRAVVRVLTPGLVTHDEDLSAKENNFLVAIVAEEGGFGFGTFDLSTAELASAVLPDLTSALCELHRASPKEILLAGSVDASVRAAINATNTGAAVRESERLAEVDDRLDALLEGGIGDAAVTHLPLAREAAAMLLDFAHRCTPLEKLPVRRIAAHDTSRHLRIDEAALTHLELTRSLDGGREGTLLSTIDATVTSPGARLLRARMVAPIRDVRELRRRHDQVEAFVVHARARAELRAVLARISDLERLCVRASLHEASPRDLGLIRDALLAAPEASELVHTLPTVTARDDELFGPRLDGLPDLAMALDAALIDKPSTHAKEGGFVKDGFDAALDATRLGKRGATERIMALEAELRASTGASTLRIRYNSVFGYYVEVTRSHLAKVPESFRRKQTVATGERYTTDALDEIADDIEVAEVSNLEREREIFDDLVRRVIEARERIMALARQISEWDVAAGLAEVAHRFDYVRPEIDDSEVLSIVQGRHPVVERHAALGRFVPNDTHLDASGERMWLVTGPNMAGKSTLMRQTALIVVLAQMGSFVPAKSARVGVVDRLLSRVGASDNVARGDSTFMVEMRETAFILRHATQRSFVILDEIGRGTSTYDGLAIAWSVAEHLSEVIRCRAMFATHYHEITELGAPGAEARGIVNVSVSAREHAGGIVFLHQLNKGAAQGSYGIAVAKLAGLPNVVVGRANALLTSFEEKPRNSKRGPDKAQLSLFGAPSAPSVSPGEREVLATLRASDENRMTPLAALALIAELRQRLAREG